MRLAGLDSASPRKFGAKQRTALMMLPPLAALTIRSFVRSSPEIRHEEYWKDTLAKHGKAIIGGWHENILLGTSRFRDTHYFGIASESFDGELATRLMRKLGMNTVRGSSANVPLTVVRRLMKALEAGDVVGLTPDGPRGPRRVAKPGIAILASRAQVPIVPHAFAPSGGWRLNSWDRMVIPKPFAKIVCLCGEPIPPPPRGDKAAITATTRLLEERLNDLHDTLDREFPAVAIQTDTA